MDQFDQILGDILTNLSGIEYQELATSSNIFETGIDSFTFMQIIVELESQFNVKFDVTEITFAEFKTLDGIKRKVKDKMK